MTTRTRTVAVGWFEIPASKLARAKAFYKTVFDAKLSAQSFGPMAMEEFSWAQDASGAPGTLVKAEG